MNKILRYLLLIPFILPLYVEASLPLQIPGVAVNSNTMQCIYIDGADNDKYLPKDWKVYTDSTLKQPYYDDAAGLMIVGVSQLAVGEKECEVTSILDGGGSFEECCRSLGYQYVDGAEIFGDKPFFNTSSFYASILRWLIFIVFILVVDYILFYPILKKHNIEKKLLYMGTSMIFMILFWWFILFLL